MVNLKAIGLLLVVLSLSTIVSSAGKNKIDDIVDQKDWKKLLKTKNNVLTIFHDLPKGGAGSDIMATLNEVVDKVKGIATLVSIDCNDKEGKKLCKKLKVSVPSSQNFILKHYKEGAFHKDYDRKQTASSIVNFLKDPTADMPWEEDDAAADVVHITDPQHFQKFFKKEKGRVLVMFYAPWCGFCKRLKPDYQAAATEIKDVAIMAAVNVDQPGNSVLSRKFNITGFPTIIYFEGGVEKYHYPGDNNKNAMVSFLKNPSPSVASEKKAAEAPWSEEAGDVHHLTNDNFDAFVKENPSVLVMFYAPWCGHCKKMKPGFSAAATKLKNEGIAGKLAAVDATIERALGERFKVKGYPTVKYFKDGEEAFDAGHVRDENAIVNFMKDPKEPPPPPPPEKPWSEEPSDVVHLTEETFKPFLKKKKHVLVMFYAPWCGHCKRAKPEFTEAAADFHDDPKAEFAAVDCTQHSSVCSAYEVSGYPTIKYFKYFDKERKSYDGGRTRNDFVTFMRDPENPNAGKPPPAPSPEEAWADHDGANFILHPRGNDEFSKALSEKDHALVAFYAPWCGHCKAMKADFAGAAKWLANDGKLSHAIVAVDATSETEISSKFDISGYPTIKYFARGKFVEDYNGGRRKMDFVEYIKKKGGGAAANKDEL